MPATARHRFQLVFQFRSTTLEDYDSLVAVEELFVKTLRGKAKLDGHDCGYNEFNIFVHTDTPAESFAQLRPVLVVARRLSEVRVAYREFGSDTFSNVWPQNDQQAFVIA